MKILLFVLTLFLSQAVVAEVAVIVNPSNSSEVSKSDIKRIFLGKNKSFSGGGKATVYYLAEGHAAREKFNKKALGKSSKQLKAYWSKLIFTGKGTPPDSIGEIADLIDIVSSEEGAIAYIDAADVTDAVKVVATF